MRYRCYAVPSTTPCRQERQGRRWDLSSSTKNAAWSSNDREFPNSQVECGGHFDVIGIWKLVDHGDALQLVSFFQKYCGLARKRARIAGNIYDACRPQTSDTLGGLLSTAR